MDDGKRSDRAQPGAELCLVGAGNAGAQEAAQIGSMPTTKAKVASTPARSAVRWTASREASFLAALAETANVRAAARASGLSPASVYMRRMASDSFRAAWAEALREGYVRLETMLLDRALNGSQKTVWHGGKKVGTTREYSDPFALALLRYHRGAIGGAGAPTEAPADAGDAEETLAGRLAEMNRRLGGAG